jgi:hypothetical protein
MAKVQRKKVEKTDDQVSKPRMVISRGGKSAKKDQAHEASLTTEESTLVKRLTDLISKIRSERARLREDIDNSKFHQ